MSQVVVTHDKLSILREKSRTQERKIQREAVHQRWHMSDITKRDPVAMVLGFLALPIAAFWGLLMFFLSLAFGAVLWLFRGLAKVVGGKAR